MPEMQSPGELEHYREIFSEVWESALLRTSIVEVTDNVKIPVGELIFFKEPQDDRSEVLYNHDAVTIHEIVATPPFKIVDEIIDGNVRTARGSVEIEADFYRNLPSGYFGTGENSEVQEERPQTELNSVVEIEIPEEEKSVYSNLLDELDERLQRAEEPYYRLSRCEEHYFEHLSLRDRERPHILIFADPGIEFGVDDDGILNVSHPPSITGELSISVMPQDQDVKGWRIDLDNEELDRLKDGRDSFSEDLGLEEVDRTYVQLYLQDERIDFIEHLPGDLELSNARYDILETYDQRNYMEQYLESPDSDIFEIAVLNLLSTAGYIVQWFGGNEFDIPNWSQEIPRPKDKEVDIIAYDPNYEEGLEIPRILFVECTVGPVSQKEDMLERSQAVLNDALNWHITPENSWLINFHEVTRCIATSQSSGALDNAIVNDLEEKGIEILHRERLKNLYEISKEIDGTTVIGTETMDVM